jgi:mycoredoxin
MPSAAGAVIRRGCGAAVAGNSRLHATVDSNETLSIAEESSVDFTPESGTITMFSTTWCGYCNRLKKQLDAQGIGYTEINIEEVEGTAELVEQLNGGNQTVPTVLFPDGTAATNPSAAEVKKRLAA